MITKLLTPKFLNVYNKTINLFLCIKHFSTIQRVVVTGLGIVSPVGVGVKHAWKNLLNGKIGTVSLDGTLYKDIPCKVAAFVPRGEEEGFLNLKNYIKESDFKRYSLSSLYALVAAEEALKDAKWLPNHEEDLLSTGVAIGTGMVDLLDIVATGNILNVNGYSKVSPFFVPRILSNMPAGHIAIKYGFKGLNHCVSTACATGLHAIGDAYNFIKNGYASVIVCGSSEAVISPLSVAGFCRMRALSTSFNESPQEASRPFDARRDGFVMGEGAGILVLENLEHALKRKANIYAEVLGYGLSGDAHHITSPSSDGNGAYRSMEMALSFSKRDIREVGYINAHATSTPLGDSIELKAIYDLFKNHSKNLVISSTKGATGHLLGAAGSIEAIFTVLSCYSKTVPPNVNLNHLDSSLAVNMAANSSQPWPDSLYAKRIGLTNSFGFGGTNATIVFSKTEQM